jgi:hypothetical protein
VVDAPYKNPSEIALKTTAKSALTNLRPSIKGKTMAKQNRAALYVRVSTDHQTVENQNRELRQIAERRVWTVVEV